MNNKSLLITTITASAILILVAIIGIWMIFNKPSADIVYETPPMPPSDAPQEQPGVPAEPRIAGDVLDDGIVDSLDVNGVIVNWRKDNADYKIAADGTTVNATDIALVFSHWKCYENKPNCPYK